MQVASLERHVNAADLPPERLATNTQISDHDKIAEVSRQFEAVLLRQILRDAQKPIVKSSLVQDSAANGIYRDLVTEKLADSVSKSGTFGLAKSVESQLNRQLRPQSNRPGAALHPASHLQSAASPATVAAATAERHFNLQHGAELLRGPRAAQPPPQAKLPSTVRHHD